MVKRKMRWAIVKCVFNGLLALAGLYAGAYLLVLHEQTLISICYFIWAIVFGLDAIKNILEYRMFEREFLIEENERLDREIIARFENENKRK